MLLVGYCYGIRSEHRWCEEVSLNLAYRWFCGLNLDDTIPDHSSFSKNRPGRFRDGDLLRLVFERIVSLCLKNGLIKGEAFATDASVIESDASRYHGQPPETIDWSTIEKPSRAVREYLNAFNVEAPEKGRTQPKVISRSDPASAWTAKANTRVQFGNGPNDLIDTEHAILGWLVEQKIASHIPVWNKSTREGDTFGRADSTFDPEQDQYTCPAGKVLKQYRRNFSASRQDNAHDGIRKCRASQKDCRTCALTQQCCPNMPARNVLRSIHEDARDEARRRAGTPEFALAG